MRRQLVFALTFAGACSAPAAATSLDVNLDFAAFNQSQWSPGPAVNEEARYRFPDPYFGATVNLARVDLDPVSTLLDFVGDFLGINLVTGVSIAPTATFTTGFDAGYHVNSGSIDLSYPTQVVLSLPNQVNYGEAFTVGAQPFSGAARASPYPLADLAALLGAPAADKLSQLSVTGVDPGTVVPQAGFTTQFPHAEANLSFHVEASGQLNAEACVILAGCDTVDAFNLQGIKDDVQIVELNSSSGLQVLDQNVIPFNQQFTLPGGIGTLTFQAPNGLSVDGTARSGGALEGSAGQDLLSLGFDVDQLLPVVGAVLHNSIGPFAYDLASIEPTLSLGISQTMAFEPTVMVNLHFSDPVIDTRTNEVTRDVAFAVGDSVALMPASIGSSSVLNELSITPTFTLANAFTNDTQLTVATSIDVQALALTAPVNLGPACCGPLELARYDLGSIGPDDPFQINVPSITAGAQNVARGVSAAAGGAGALEAWYEAALAGIRAVATTAPDEAGRAQYRIYAGDMLIDSVSGRLLYTRVDSGADDRCLSRLGICDIQLLSDQDISFVDPDDANNVLDLGRLLCLSCVDLAGPLASSLSLNDGAGKPLFFSDVRSFPAIPTVEQILDPASPFYDERLATGQYFDRQFITPAESPRGASVPEPATLVLLGSGLMAAAALRRRPLIESIHAFAAGKENGGSGGDPGGEDRRFPRRCVRPRRDRSGMARRDVEERERRAGTLRTDAIGHLRRLGRQRLPG